MHTVHWSRKNVALKSLSGFLQWISMASLVHIMCSCSSGPEGVEGFDPKAKILRLNISTEPPTLDPRQATDTTSAAVITMLFEGLTRVSPEGFPVPAMAERIRITDDGRRYHFKLREAYWSNGDPVTSRDFADTWKQVLNPRFPSSYAYQLHVIKNGRAITEGSKELDELGIKLIDDYTLEVELEHPTPYFLEVLAHHIFFPVNQKVALSDPEWAEDPEAGLVSNGPFELIRWKHHDEIVVKRSETYWDRDDVKVDGIHISMVEDPATELHMFQAGDLDWAGQPLSLSLPTEAIPELKRHGALHTQPIAGVYFYMFNTDMKPFNNAKIRRAFSYAIGRKRIVDNITQADQRPAMGLVPPTMPFEQRPFFSDEDIEHAKRLFTQGLRELKLSPDELPTLTLSYNQGDHHLKIAQAIQQQWHETFGIEVELKSEEWKVYLSSLKKRRFMIGRLGWVADFNDPVNFLEIFKYRNSGNNSTGWEHPDYVQLLEKSAREPDQRRRHELLVKAERILMHEMPVAPIYFLTNTHLRSKKLDNVYLSPLGMVDFRWASLE